MQGSCAALAAFPPASPKFDTPKFPNTSCETSCTHRLDAASVARDWKDMSHLHHRSHGALLHNYFWAPPCDCDSLLEACASAKVTAEKCKVNDKCLKQLSALSLGALPLLCTERNATCLRSRNPYCSLRYTRVVGNWTQKAESFAPPSVGCILAALFPHQLSRSTASPSCRLYSDTRSW